MNVRTVLQLANAAATAALAVALVETWREVRLLRRWIVDNALSEERLRQKLGAALAANDGVSEARPRIPGRRTPRLTAHTKRPPSRRDGGLCY
jgi:hypothetical protein